MMLPPLRLRERAGLAGLFVAVTLTGLVAAAAPPVKPPVTPPAKPATETPPPSGSAPKNDEPPAETPATPPPTLDDLLGIGGERKTDPVEGAADTGETDAAPADAAPPTTPSTGDTELDAALGQGSMDDVFQLALDGMRLAADRLGQRQTDLDTQRTQEEVMRRLEMLIDQAQQQQQQSSSSSSSSSQQQQQQNPGEQQSRSDAASQPQEQSGQSEGGSQQNGEMLPPGFQDGPLDGTLSEAGSEWGSLPERIREMLLQGRNERFSSLYERLTRSYYRRLAEEGSR